MSGKTVNININTWPKLLLAGAVLLVPWIVGAARIVVVAFGWSACP